MENYYIRDSLEQLNKESIEAIKKEKITEKINAAERLGYFFLAGISAKEGGLFKRAYENFKTIKHIEEIEKLNNIIFPEHYLKVKKIKRIEDKKERDYELNNKHRFKKANDYLMWPLKRCKMEQCKDLPEIIKRSN